MATATYTLINSTTLSSSASTVTFSSIPTGGDLAIVVETTLTGSASINFRLNNDSGSNYSSAVNRIDFILTGGESFAAGSTFHLYNIAKAL